MNTLTNTSYTLTNMASNVASSMTWDTDNRTEGLYSCTIPQSTHVPTSGISGSVTLFHTDVQRASCGVHKLFCTGGVTTSLMFIVLVVADWLFGLYGSEIRDKLFIGTPPCAPDPNKLHVTSVEVKQHKRNEHTDQHINTDKHIIHTHQHSQQCCKQSDERRHRQQHSKTVFLHYTAVKTLTNTSYTLTNMASNVASRVMKEDTDSGTAWFYFCIIPQWTHWQTHHTHSPTWPAKLQAVWQEETQTAARCDCIPAPYHRSWLPGGSCLATAASASSLQNKRTNWMEPSRQNIMVGVELESKNPDHVM